MGNSSGVGAVVHHKHFQLRDVVDDNRFETVGVDVSGGFIRTVSNTGHGEGTLESTANTSINTLGLAPGRIADSDELV